MKFLDREDEMRRLLSLSARDDGGLAVLWGRRRVGKTRLMLEWVRRSKGIYTLADQSSGAVQRRYFADSLSSVLDGFAESEYPDWRTLLRAVRAALWQRHRVRLVSEAWEDLSRASVSRLNRTTLGEDGPWGPPRRFWLGNGPEWDIVASSLDEKALLLGEVKWSDKPVSESELDRIGRALLAKGLPDGTWAREKRVVHAVFVPELQGPPRRATKRRP